MPVFFILLLLISNTSFAIYYEIKPHQDNLPTLNEYLGHIGAANARMKSKCKDDNCKYWLKIGNRKHSTSKGADLIEKSRYADITYALYEDDAGIYVASNHHWPEKLTNKTLTRCITSGRLATGISSRGKPICISDDTLFAGNQKIDLPVEAVYATIGTSYAGHWQAAYVGQDYNVYVGNDKGLSLIHI